MHLRHAATAVLLTALPAPAFAGIFTDDLTRCTVNATTPADRTALMRWTFIVASANPAFANLAVVNETQRQQSFREVGAIFNRLVLHDCRREAVLALRAEGGGALGIAFQTLGELAGREMMNSPASAASAADLDRFLDMEGVAALTREAGVTAAGPPAPGH